MPLRCTDTWRSPRIGHIRVIVCVGVFCMRGCIGTRTQIPLQCPNWLPDQGRRYGECDGIMRRPPGSAGAGGCVCVGGWRQLRSEPRGKQKPERGNGDGKLTGEAGPALVAEIHRGYVVGGRSRVVGFLSVLCET